jgi:hypothetical protein
MDLSKWLERKGPCWVERLAAIKAEIRAKQDKPRPRVADPWEARLADLKATERDGYERVPTYIVFDHLGVRRSERHAGATRRLARAMRQLGWRRSRFRIARGSHQRVRGFERASPRGADRGE